MTSQPTPPKVSPQETAGLMIRAYENPLVSLDKAGSETQISDGGYVKVGGTGWPVIMPFTMRFHVQNANQVTSKTPDKKKPSQTQVIDVQKSSDVKFLAVFFRIRRFFFCLWWKIRIEMLLRRIGAGATDVFCQAAPPLHSSLPLQKCPARARWASSELKAEKGGNGNKTDLST